MTGLYIHIPLCKKKCNYCDFYSVPISSLDNYSEVVSSIVREVDMRKEEFLTSDPIETIFIGGGTPNILNTRQLYPLLSKVRNSLNFNKITEYTIETNPEFITKDKLQLFHDMGINRISMGVQSFDDRIMKFMGRITSKSVVYNAIEMIRGSKINNFNIDMIFGFPYQEMNTIENDLKQLIDASPNHVSYYNFMLEEGTPIYNMIKGGNVPYPDEELGGEMYMEVINQLELNDYSIYEISNFCKGNCFSKHNLNYWDRGKYIGLGPSATSYDGNARFTNIDDISNYVKLITSGKLAITQSEVIDIEKSLIETLMLSLRKSSGLDMDLFRSQFGINLKTVIENTMRKEVISNDIIYITGNTLRMTHKGFLIYDYFISEMLFSLENLGHIG